MREWQGEGARLSLCIIGTKGLNFFRRLSVPILANVSHLGDRPHVKDLIGTVKVMLDAYRAGELDRLFLLNAQFVSARHGRAAAALGLHLRAGGRGDSRRTPDALHRVPGVSRCG